MDPTLYALAFKLYPEMPEQVSHHHEIYLQEVHRMRYSLGRLLMRVGQKQQEGELQAQLRCDRDLHNCVEALG